MCMCMNSCEMASIVFNYHQCCPLALSLPGQRVKEQLQKARISVTINMCTPISKNVSIVYKCTYLEVQSGSSFQSRLAFLISLSEQLLLHTPSWLSIASNHINEHNNATKVHVQQHTCIRPSISFCIFIYICMVNLIKTMFQYTVLCRSVV